MTADPGPPNPAPDPPQPMQTPAEDLLIGQIAVEKGILRREQLEEGLREHAASRTRGARKLKSRPHELVFNCRGESVSASLDGNNVPVEPNGRPREGALQFDASGPGLRVFSVDYR